MTLEVEKAIEQQDIVDRFNLRIRDYVGNHNTINPGTVFSGYADVWNGQVATQGHSTINNLHRIYYNTRASAVAANGIGAPATTLYNNGTKPAAEMAASDFDSIIGTGDNIGHVVKVIKNFMRNYSRIHYARFQNTGNVGPYNWYGVVHGNNESSAAANSMDSDMIVAKEQSGVKDGASLTAVSMIDLIERCRTIWYNRCVNGGVRTTYKFSFCHNSCHSNVTCYNSRGRR
jgi:hypothetical protein